MFIIFNELIFFKPFYPHKVKFAGGMYIKYNSNSPFSQRFPYIFDICSKNQDIDLFYNCNQYINENFSGHNSYSNKIGNLNIIYIKDNYLNICDEFDFDCCKIWNCPDLNNKTFVKYNLIICKTIINEPTLVYKLNQTPIFSSCNVCTNQKRSLKYFFKYCFTNENLIQEIEKATTIFNKSMCNICNTKYF